MNRGLDADEVAVIISLKYYSPSSHLMAKLLVGAISNNFYGKGRWGMRRLLRERIDWRDPAGHEVTEEACRLPRGKRLIPHRPLITTKVSRNRVFKNTAI
jgi:hypothetical protein